MSEPERDLERVLGTNPQTRQPVTVRDRLLQSLAAGSFIDDAVAAAGIDRSTYVAWMQSGEADRATGIDSPLAEFYDAATRATAEARVGAVAHVRKAMQTDWRAAAWYLERSDPERWAVKDKPPKRGASLPGLELSATQ